MDAIAGYDNYKSSEEIYMAWWLEDAVKHGIVLRWQYEPRGWELCEQHDILVTKEKKNKAKTREITTKTIIEQQTYTCDFRIVWNPKYEGLFFKCYDFILHDQSPYFYATAESDDVHGAMFVSYIDVKPGFAQASQQSFVRFPVKQAWVYDKYGVYVQKIVVLSSVKSKLTRKYSGLFPNTFVPSRYLMTDGNTQRRKINFEFKLIENYVKH